MENCRSQLRFSAAKVERIFPSGLIKSLSGQLRSRSTWLFVFPTRSVCMPYWRSDSDWETRRVFISSTVRKCRVIQFKRRDFSQKVGNVGKSPCWTYHSPRGCNHQPWETAPARLSSVYRLVMGDFVVFYVLLTCATITGSFGFCLGGL